MRVCLRAIAFACLLLLQARAHAYATQPNGGLAHVNAAIAVPQSPAAPPDPCASRRWSFAHLFAFCGRIRIVPADDTERKLWWGQRISEFLDAFASARGQSDLFAQRQIVVAAHGRTLQGRPVTFLLRGQRWTIAEEEGTGTPAQAEGNFWLKPFAASGFGGYALGFGLLDVGQSLLTGLVPSLGLRPLDELSRRAILTNNISAHLQGADSWLPIFTASRNVNAVVSACQSLAAQSWSYDPALDRVFIARAPKRCATIWP